MTVKVQLAVDVMSGDHGLRCSLPAAERALTADPQLSLILVGDQVAISAHFGQRHSARLSIIHAPDTVAMAASPAAVLRDPTATSLRLALDQVAQGQAAGMVSAGNTGALMVLARHILGMLPGFSRPALCSALPVVSGHTYMLDLGANVDCRASQLHEFARMGAALATAMHPGQEPGIALLSNGEEASKGNDQIRLTAQYLQEDKQLNFIGSIEASELLSGRAAVIVCDGMLGNVALKSMEGAAARVATDLQAGLAGSFRGRLAARLAAAEFTSWSSRMNPATYSGAFMLGLDAVVVKSHGDSSADSMVKAIAQAALCVRNNMVPSLQRQLKIEPSETRH